MAAKSNKLRKGKWIVKLEKLQECLDCHDFFTDSFSFKEHMKDHHDETRIKTESQEIKLEEAIESKDQENSKYNLNELFKVVFNETGEKEFQCNNCENVYCDACTICNILSNICDI